MSAVEGSEGFRGRPPRWQTLAHMLAVLSLAKARALISASARASTGVYV